MSEVQESEGVLSQPVSELKLGVRANKVMVMLGIQTVGGLVRRSAGDLMECKNFGVSSLNQIRERLEDLGLRLRDD